jgi:uracil-DNA glycosylase
VARDDGLELRHTRIFAAVRCAPPDNKPTPAERDTCAPWLHREVELIRPTLRVVVALGAFAWAAWWPALSRVYGHRPPSPRPPFGHGALARVAPDSPALLGCYHVSQQNTFTGRLTPTMLDAVLARAKELAGLS